MKIIALTLFSAFVLFLFLPCLLFFLFLKRDDILHTGEVVQAIKTAKRKMKRIQNLI